MRVLLSLSKMLLLTFLIPDRCTLLSFSGTCNGSHPCAADFYFLLFHLTVSFSLTVGINVPSIPKHFLVNAKNPPTTPLYILLQTVTVLFPYLYR